MTNPRPESAMSVTELRAALQSAEADYNQATNQLATLEKEEQKIKEKRTNLEEDRRRASNTYRRICEYLLIGARLPKAVTDLRKKYFDLLNQSASVDITVREQKEFRENADEALGQLREECNHPFVLVTRDKYAGSQTYDYDDAHSECRECLVCGVSESSSSDEKNIFRTLCQDDVRLIKRDLRRCSRTNHGIRFAFLKLSTIRKIFRASAGITNIVDSAWPQKDSEKEEKKAA